jgi:hypothetical protein
MKKNTGGQFKKISKHFDSSEEDSHEGDEKAGMEKNDENEYNAGAEEPDDAFVNNKVATSLDDE